MNYPSVSAFLAEPKAVFTTLSAFLSIIAFSPYIRDTLAGRTKPHRASWLIWSVLAAIAFASNLSDGIHLSLWFIGAQAVPTMSIFLLSIPLGHGDYFSPRNKAILACAALGVMLWVVLDTPAYALGITIIISTIGAIPTVIKSYTSPQSETLVTWVLCMLSSLCAVISILDGSAFVVAYPLYLLTLYMCITAAIMMGRKAKTYPMSLQP